MRFREKAKAVVGNHDQFIIDQVYYHTEPNWCMNGREQTLDNLGIPYKRRNLRELLLPLLLIRVAKISPHLQSG